jgi:hypothetical protein
MMWQAMQFALIPFRLPIFWCARIALCGVGWDSNDAVASWGLGRIALSPASNNL